jgi:hypothetical protein
LHELRLQVIAPIFRHLKTVLELGDFSDDLFVVRKQFSESRSGGAGTYRRWSLAFLYSGEMTRTSAGIRCSRLIRRTSDQRPNISIRDKMVKAMPIKNEKRGA